MKIWSLEETEKSHLYDITIFVACYNEEPYVYDALRGAAASLREIGCSFEIIVIDDASTDKSVERIQAFLDENEDLPVTLKVNEKNCGLAFNFVEAAYLGKGKYYRTVFGDNPEPKEAFASIFKCIGTADIIIPYMKSTGRTFFRIVLSKTFVFIVNFISGYRLKYYNGAPIFRRSHVIRWHPHSYGFGFQADLVTRLLDEGCSYVEVPSWSVENKFKLSTALTFRNFLSVLHSLIEIGIRRAKNIMFGKNNRLL